MIKKLYQNRKYSSGGSGRDPSAPIEGNTIFEEEDLRQSTILDIRLKLKDFYAGNCYTYTPLFM